MKKLKFGIFALAMGLAIASCGGGDTTETETADSTTVMDAGATGTDMGTGTTDMGTGTTGTIDTTMTGTNNTGSGTGSGADTMGTGTQH
jgi:hypothetical protein